MNVYAERILLGLMALVWGGYEAGWWNGLDIVIGLWTFLAAGLIIRLLIWLFR